MEKGDNYRVEGSPEKSEIPGVVSGQIEGKEWTEEQDKAAMEKRLQIEKKEEAIVETLDELQEKYPQYEDIVNCFESASVISDPRGRLEVVMDNLLDLSKALDRNKEIASESERRRISMILNRLRELL